MPHSVFMRDVCLCATHLLEVRHGNERAVVNCMDSVFVEDENVDVNTLGERVCVERRQVVTTKLDVAQ